MRRIIVSLYWIDRIDFYSIQKEYYELKRRNLKEKFFDKYPEFNDPKNYVLYMFSINNKILYIGKTNRPMYKRIFEDDHSKIRKLKKKYPFPNQIFFRCAYICNLKDNLRKKHLEANVRYLFFRIIIELIEKNVKKEKNNLLSKDDLRKIKNEVLSNKSDYNNSLNVKNWTTKQIWQKNNFVPIVNEIFIQIALDEQIYRNFLKTNDKILKDSAVKALVEHIPKTIEDVLIWMKKPEFNIMSRLDFWQFFKIIKIKNEGDFEPLEKILKIKLNRKFYMKDIISD